MSGRRLARIVLLTCVPFVAAACGGTKTTTVTATSTDTRTETRTVTVTETVTASASTTPQARAGGEIVLHGDTTPKVLGPITLRPGGYVFSFKQFDPSDPTKDWTQTTSLVVSLESAPQAEDGPVLVNATREAGSTLVAVSGTYYVSVSFGDYAYELRFTPR